VTADRRLRPRQGAPADGQPGRRNQTTIADAADGRHIIASGRTEAAACDKIAKFSPHGDHEIIHRLPLHDFGTAGEYCHHPVAGRQRAMLKIIAK
jgi:hypothetical protein